MFILSCIFWRHTANVTVTRFFFVSSTISRYTAGVNVRMFILSSFSEDTQQMWTLEGFSFYPLLSWDTQQVWMIECLFYPELSGVTQQVWLLPRVWRCISFSTTWRHTARVNVRFILSSTIWRHSRCECAQQAEVMIQTHKRLNRTLISTGQRKTCAKFQCKTPLFQAPDRQIKNDEWELSPYPIWVGAGGVSICALYNTLNQCTHICYILYKSHVLVMVSKCQMWGCVLLY